MESEPGVCAGPLSPASSGPGRPSPALSSDLELEDPQAEAHHSSEEELEGFNCREREKRKWCQVGDPRVVFFLSRVVRLELVGR